MKVKVKAFATLRDIMDKEVWLELDDRTTVSRLLEILSGRYEGLRGELFDGHGALKEYVNILKNGRNIFFLKNLDTVLEDGDDIAIFPPVAGG
jgi:molybdopterin synthase sulfur carrier subunit